jgi:hypothetical protein
MYKNPAERFPSILLANAKLASSFFSFILFIVSGSYLIYLVNGIVDGSLGVLILTLYRAAFGKGVKT